MQNIYFCIWKTICFAQVYVFAYAKVYTLYKTYSFAYAKYIVLRMFIVLHAATPSGLSTPNGGRASPSPLLLSHAKLYSLQKKKKSMFCIVNLPYRLC